MRKSSFCLVLLLLLFINSTCFGATLKDDVQAYLQQEGMPSFTQLYIQGYGQDLVSISMSENNVDAGMLKQVCRDLMFMTWKDIRQKQAKTRCVEVNIGNSKKIMSSTIIMYLGLNGALDLEKEKGVSIWDDKSFDGAQFYDWIKNTAILCKTSNEKQNSVDKEIALRYKNGDFLTNNNFLFDSINENDVFDITSIYNKYGMVPATLANYQDGKVNVVGKWQSEQQPGSKRSSTIDISVKEGKIYVVFVENSWDYATKKMIQVKTEGFAVLDLKNNNHLIIRNNQGAIMISDDAKTGKQLNIGMFDKFIKVSQSVS